MKFHLSCNRFDDSPNLNWAECIFFWNRKQSALKLCFQSGLLPVLGISQNSTYAICERFTVGNCEIEFRRFRKWIACVVKMRLGFSGCFTQCVSLERIVSRNVEETTPRPTIWPDRSNKRHVGAMRLNGGRKGLSRIYHLLQCYCKAPPLVATNAYVRQTKAAEEKL